MVQLIELTLYAKSRKQVARILAHALCLEELKVYKVLRPMGVNPKKAIGYIYPMFYPVSIFIIVRLDKEFPGELLTTAECDALRYLILYPQNLGEHIFTGVPSDLPKRVSALKKNRFRHRWESVRDSKPKIIRPEKG